ncbi:phage major capsid protein [Mesorhizobium sp. CGMCC 1.15528]|uniref:Phage major capsid protein n=1 Tax=Mesorhizobium zhangyense TaxID=1776730 RepID=A0A7C9RC94_9HYPH|nr:phage major capsid protein [Mesorhizobium zhangyense]NGN44979.1 phage major capsid protein [Mesorhizobium zhangyense]
MDATEIKSLIEEQGRAFEAFKAEHNAALADVKKGTEDVVRTDKVERINTAVSDLQAALDEQAAKLAALQTSGAQTEADKPVNAAYNAAFDKFFREGDERELRAAIKSAPKADLNIGTPAEGGYFAPVEWDRTVVDALKIVSAMRGIATVQQVSSNAFTKVYNDRDTASGWVGETAARPKTGHPELASETFTLGEIYANPAATQRILDDSLINIETWLSNEVQTEFAYQEGVAFVSGDGTNKPRGLLDYQSAGDHPFGAIPTVKSGAAAALKLEGLVDLVYDLPSERTPNARFTMNRKTQGAIRKIKDGNGNFIWQPGLQAGQPANVLGFPVTELAAMQDVAAGNIPIIFGDFSGYLVLDRLGVRVLRDPFTNKPFVQFYTTKRVGGGVVDPTVFRYHKIEA